MGPRVSNLLLLQPQVVRAAVMPDEDFAPPALMFVEADGVTPIDLTGIAFTATIGAFPALTSGNGLIASGSTLIFFVPAAQKNWPTGRYLRAAGERWRQHPRPVRRGDADGRRAGVVHIDALWVGVERRGGLRFFRGDADDADRQPDGGPAAGSGGRAGRRRCGAGSRFRFLACAEQPVSSRRSLPDFARMTPRNE
jgi:hypothetical protein